MSSAKPQKSRVGLKAFTALRSDNYRNFWLSSFGQSAAQGMQTLTLSWLVLELTGSIAQFGLSVFLQGLPMSMMMIFGGVLADRVSRIKLIMVSQIVKMGLMFLLASLVISGQVHIWHVYVITPLIGAFQGLVRPSSASAISDLVDRKDVMNAVALTSTMMNVTQIAGPSIAGFIISGAGIGTALMINASLYVVGIFWLTRIKNFPRLPRTIRTNPLQDMLNGVRYVRDVPPVFAIITIGCIMGLFAHPAQQMVPALVKEEFDLGAKAAGFLLMSAGIGALIGNFALASLGDTKQKNFLLLLSGAVYGVAILGLAASPWFASSLVALFFMGMGRSVFVSLGNTLLQLIIPRDYLGKSLAWWNVGGAFTFVGAMPLGFLADAIGLRVAIAVWVLVYMATLLFVGMIRPAIRKIEANPQSVPAPVRA